MRRLEYLSVYKVYLIRIGKMRTLFYILIIAICCISCNVCETGNNDNSYKPNEIYFSAKTLNSINSNTFGVSADGTNLYEIISNSLIFSPPSNSNSMSYTSNQSISKDIINYINLETNTDIKIIDNNNYNKGIKSIISKDGNYFAFIVSDSLFLYNISTTEYILISEKIVDNTLPAFSPDSKYLSFVELDGEKFCLKVSETANLANEVISQNYTDIRTNPQITFYPVWMRDSKRVCIVDTRSSTLQNLFIFNIDTKQIQNFNISNIGCLSFGVAVNSDKFAICAFDGNLYIADIKDDKYSTEKITNFSIDEACLYPRFSPDGKRILFSRAYQKNILQFNSSLYVINIIDKKSNYLFSNVYMGFWY